MKSVLALFLVSMLTACGVETATTAATSAEIKRREAEQARKTLDQTKQKIEQATQQMQKSAERAGDASKD